MNAVDDSHRKPDSRNSRALPTAAAAAADTPACCGGGPPAVAANGRRRIDWMLWSSGIVVAVAYSAHVLTGSTTEHGAWAHFAAGAHEMMNAMWWGILLGIVFVGLLDRVPRDVVIAALAGNRRSTGILRATAAGVLFDLCSHGILMVGMKLYERGASIGQTAAFLLASPWNSLSLTVILIALIGWWYTLAFILLSAVIAIATGWLFDFLVANGRLPDNPARIAAGSAPSSSLREAVRLWLNDVRPSWSGLGTMLWDGFKGSRMVLRWLLFGVVLAAALRALLPADVFADWFGPTLLGVFATVIAATIIEVCSEGSAPIAADLVTRASAPGNGFTFLMAGVATDYTEIMSLRDTTGSWKLALMLPVIAVPQTLLIGVLLNYSA
ncbi:MAG: permease [Hyphomicrobiaceae bacterium]